MLVIIEGADRTGKTTLSYRLAERVSGFGRPMPTLAHCGPPTTHPLDEYEARLYGYRPNTGDHMILDRWHLGELVYPRIVDRPTVYDAAMNAHVELLLRSRGAVLVHAIGDPDRVAAAVAAETGSANEAARSRLAVAAFRDVVGRSTLPLLTYSHDGPDRQVDEIVARAILAARDAAPLNDFVTYVGPPQPRVLLLGDTRGVDGRHATGPAPAFVPYAGTSGHYLLAALARFGTGLGDYGLANACDVDDPAALWVALGRPEVVALGTRAAARLGELDVPRRVVDHPQYVRRFHHDRPLEYARHVMLDEVPAWSPAGNR